MGTRVGMGFDIHPFTDDKSRPLMLGGVEIEGRGLSGHSDADVLCHAVSDALLGAAGMGDIGTLFPDSDPTLLGADSAELLARVVLIVTGSWKVVNVDCTVVAESPRLSGYRDEIKTRLEDIVGAPVNVKAKRGEGLGALGRSEGIACMAVALLEQR